MRKWRKEDEKMAVISKQEMRMAETHDRQKFPITKPTYQAYILTKPVPKVGPLVFRLEFNDGIHDLAASEHHKPRRTPRKWRTRYQAQAAATSSTRVEAESTTSGHSTDSATCTRL